jgi:DNA-binding response OmpR family regulator
MNVLILDRSELARVVKAILNSHEHRSFQSRSLDGAERILRRESVDAIVLNVGSMGRCSAQWVRTWLWGRRPSPRIVVIAAEELEADERALLEVYHATLLEPPITPRLLLNALGEARHGARPKRRPISRRFRGTIKPAKPSTDD